MSNFPNIINTDCIPTGPTPPDPRCADPAFALAKPGICSTTPVLILKPSVILTCGLDGVQFETFLDQGGVETKLTSGLVYSTSNPAVAVISASTGNATGVAPGDVTITVKYQNLVATGNLTVVGTGSGASCCSATTVATMLVVDISKSMSLSFGNGYATKQDYAKALATRYANETNTQKGDVIGLISFDETPHTLVTPTSNISAVTSAIAGLTVTTLDTGIGLALEAAMTALAAVTADLKVIVLISDGEDKDPNAADDPVAISEGWKSATNIILCAGIRAHDSGFNLLNAISTGGFFVNSYPATAQSALDAVSGLKGYICAGNCVPPGNIYQPMGELNYTNFINWNVIRPEVDLLGDGFYDFLPGNGLYVNMRSLLTPPNTLSKAQLDCKTTFTFVPGKTYRLSLDVAGNQTTAGTNGIAVLLTSGNTPVPHPLDQQIIITDYTQNFQTYSFNFTVPATVTNSVLRIVGETGSFEGAVLIDNIVLTDVTDLTIMFSDNFDNENVQFIPPGCGASSQMFNVPVNLPMPKFYDNSGNAVVTGLNLSTQYTINFGNASQLDMGLLILDTPPNTQTFTPPQDSGTLTGNPNQAVTATITYLAPSYYYGYAGCYGYGCLSEPPGNQLSDPNPLPDIEASFVPPTPYTSTKSVTVYCPQGTVQKDGHNTGATGTATYTSYISQGDADANATALATANANALLAAIGCAVVYTSTQSFTANCPAGSFGNPVTKSATATSMVSQADADAQALAAAMAAAIAALDCSGSNNLLPITNIGPAQGAAGTYPSVQFVSGKTGLVTNVTVNINGFTHAYCRQVCVLLKSPSGRTVVLFSGMGGPHTVGPINLVIDDAGSTVLPDFNTPVSGTFKPSPYTVIVSNTNPAPPYSQEAYWPAPAPQPNYGLTMASLIGDNPNGSWSLWVASAASVDTGSIQSWSVNITSA